MSAIEQLKEAAALLKDFGISMNGGAAKDNSAEIFKIMMAQAAADKAAATESNKFQITMMQESNKQMISLFGLMFSNMNNNKQPPVDPMAQLERSMNMIGNIVDFKNDLVPEKETAVDKIFDMLEGVLPGLINIAATKGQAAAAANPLVDVAKNSDEFKEVTGDSVKLNYLIEKTFNAHGQKNTNVMLKTLGIAVMVDEAGNITQVPPETTAPEAPPQAGENKGGEESLGNQ